jgi:hypothetical protein
VIGSRAAAAADDVDEAAGSEFLDQLTRFRRVLIVLPEGIRQPGVRIAADEGRGGARELGEVRPHLAGAERAVDADSQRLGMHHRHPECVDRLPGQGPPAAIGDGRRQDDGHLAVRVYFGCCEQRRLGAQRIDDRLDEQHVDAAVNQAAHLLRERVLHPIERDGAERGIVDVRRNRQRLVGRPNRACYEARFLRGRPLVGGLPRELRRLDVQLVHERLERIVGLRDRRPTERVRLDDVGTGLEVLLVYREDDVRARQHQHVVVAAQLFRVRCEALAAEIFFGQLMALNHRAHRPIEHEDALGQNMFEPGSNG